MKSMSKAVVTTRVSNAVAAGVTTINSSSVNNTGFGGCQFEVAFGAIVAGAATSIKAQGSHDDANWSDLEGTSVTVADDDDNEIKGIDIRDTLFKFLRCVVLRATQNSAVDSIVAHQYRASKEPVTQPATTTIEFHAAPSAGTP